MTHTMSHSDFLAISPSAVNAPPSRASRRGAVSLLSGLCLALFSSACDDAMGQDADCPANPGVTLSATDLTPGGLSAQELGTGLETDVVTTMTLQRVHTIEDTKKPKQPHYGDQGVAFDLEGAASSMELSVELRRRDEVLSFVSVGLSCPERSCPEPFRCVERASMAADLHIRAKDESFAAVIPVDLAYYPKAQRDVFPNGQSFLSVVNQGQYAFFGEGRVDASQAEGSLRTINPIPYRGERVTGSGFGVRVTIVDQQIVSLDLTATFEVEPGATESLLSSLSTPIYSSKR